MNPVAEPALYRTVLLTPSSAVNEKLPSTFKSASADSFLSLSPVLYSNLYEASEATLLLSTVAALPAV